ncbi:hypothetical protein [Methanobrevibacter sp.]|uniref:hypothetical protein n=1 Tax=Methanobrevibacter sp. TaxID=66852 RepID=UPI003865127A
MGSQFLEEYERKLVEDAEKNGKKEGIKEGFKKGEIKGKEKERIKLAKKLKKDNVPMQKIIKYTGLSLSVLQRL